jgi:Tfp pilus assembly protein PilF
MKTVYDLLGIRPDADAETVKKAFRKAAKLHHPDYHPGDPHAPFRFRQIVAANAILRDPRRRAAYDRLVALKRRRLRSKWTRIIISEAMYVGVLGIVLVIGVLWIREERTAARRPTEMAAVRLAARTDARSRDGRGDRLEVLPERVIEPSAAAPATNDTDVQAIAEQGPALGSVPAPGPVPAIGPVPNEAEFYKERGIAAYRNGDFHQAIAALDQAIRLNPGDATAYNIRGNAWDYVGASDHALADYDEAIRIDPNNPAIFHDRGMMWRHKGEFDRALVDMDRAIRFSFSDANLYSDRGLIWYEKGRYNRAIADFDRASRINPNFADAYVNGGIVLHRGSDVDHALTDVDWAIHIDPNLLDVLRHTNLRP